MEGKTAPPPYNDNVQGYGEGYGHSSGHHSGPVPVMMQPQPTPVHTTNTTVVVGGVGAGCPVCHNGSWTGSYSCCAWLLCLFCFPCGIICCLCMRKKKCTKCGFSPA